MATVQKITVSTFKFKRGNAADWTAKNPILLEGEPGYELDTKKLKIGDGITAWNDLPYIGENSNGGVPIDLSLIRGLFEKENEEDGND